MAGPVAVTEVTCAAKPGYLLSGPSEKKSKLSFDLEKLQIHANGQNKEYDQFAT